MRRPLPLGEILSRWARTKRHPLIRPRAQRDYSRATFIACVSAIECRKGRRGNGRARWLVGAAAALSTPGYINLLDCPGSKKHGLSAARRWKQTSRRWQAVRPNRISLVNRAASCARRNACVTHRLAAGAWMSATASSAQEQAGALSMHQAGRFARADSAGSPDGGHLH
jgi:hypothetical protein